MTTQKQESNVVSVVFGNREKPLITPSSEAVVSKKQEAVHTLTQSGVGKIYWERNTGRFSHAVDFFRILATERSLRIIHDFHDSHKIIQLKIIDQENREYGISIEQFIYLTCLDISSVNCPEDYIMDWLKTHGIKNEKNKEDMRISRSVLQNDELDVYHPDEILVLDTKTGNYYGCELKNRLGPIGYGEVKNFAVNVCITSLLDLMLEAYANAETSGDSIDGSSMEVSQIEGGETYYTEISTELLERLIHEAILREAKKRGEFIYFNLSPSEARSRHFQKISIPKLI